MHGRSFDLVLLRRRVARDRNVLRSLASREVRMKNAEGKANLNATRAGER